MSNVPQSCLTQCMKSMRGSIVYNKQASKHVMTGRTRQGGRYTYSCICIDECGVGWGGVGYSHLTHHNGDGCSSLVFSEKAFRSLGLVCAEIEKVNKQAIEAIMDMLCECRYCDAGDCLHACMLGIIDCSS